MLKTIAFIFLFQTMGVSFAQNESNKVYKRIALDALENNNEVMFYKGQPYTGVTFDMFENKTKRQELWWKDGLLNGTKTEYFEGGMVVRAKMNFEMGKRQGAFINFYPNGKTKLAGKYYYDLLDSTINAFYETGTPKYTYHYEKGVKNGYTITYYPNGNIEQKVNVINDAPQGFMKKFYEAGNIRLEAFYTQGVRNGMYYSYHITGQIAEESYFKNGLQDSISRYYDNVFGTLMKVEFYKNGKKNGVQITYNELGDTTAVYNFMNDIKEGAYKKYVANNMNIRKKGLFVKKKKRIYKGYVKGLDETGFYINGVLDGEFKTGLTNKEYHAEGFYTMGKITGEWKYFDIKGKVVLHEKYDETGELIYQKPKLKTASDEEKDSN